MSRIELVPDECLASEANDILVEITQGLGYVPKLVQRMPTTRLCYAPIGTSSVNEDGG